MLDIIHSAPKAFKSIFSLKAITTLAILCVISSLFSPINSASETKESLERRIKFHSKLRQISNNKMSYGYSEEMGFFCKANDYIPEFQHLFDVPKNMAITPYDIFPFKFEIMEMLANIPEVKETIDKDQTLYSYLFTMQILLYKYAPRITMDKLIRELEYKDYYEYPRPSEEIWDAHPDLVSSIYNYGEEDTHILIRLKLGFSTIRSMGIIFETLARSIQKTPWGHLIFHQLSDFRTFQSIYALIQSRTMTLHFDDYLKLEGITENDPKLTPVQKRNIIMTRKYGIRTGYPTIVSYVDICNHRSTEYINQKNKNFIRLGTKKGHYVHLSGSNWKPGDEIVFNYSPAGTSPHFAASYGFVTKKNIHDINEINIKDNYNFSMEQINLCREIGCFKFDVKIPSHIHKERKEIINYNTLSESLLNYGRVRLLRGKIDINKYHKKYIKDKSFSNSNEIGSLLFYFNALKEDLKAEQANVNECILQGSYQKKIAKKWESRLESGDPAIPTLLKRAKQKSLIYDLGFVYKAVYILQTNVVLDKILERTSYSIDNLKEKYLQKVQ